MHSSVVMAMLYSAAVVMPVLVTIQNFPSRKHHSALNKTTNYCSTRRQAYEEVIQTGGEGEGLARSNRAAAYLKIGKNREALQDASTAIKLQPTEIAFYRKG